VAVIELDSNAGQIQRCEMWIGSMMPEENQENVCADPALNLSVELPCRMVERVERYAKENGTSVNGVLIEALDNFLRRTE
jgi:hypothetical protein